MKTTDKTVRRGLAGVFVTCALGGAVATAITGPAASAAPDPCMASEVAKSVGTAATDTGEYLDDHPSANAQLTMISKQEGPQAIASLKAFFDANPQVAADLKEIQSPVTDLATQCQLPISLPQILALMQAAQQAQTPTAGLPGAQQVAGVLPGAQTPAAEVPAGTGQLPGPVAATPAVSSGA